MELKLKNIVDPSEKVRLMYEAVIELVKNGSDVSNLTIGAITAKAGIGKGTAYEYFSSKEEVIAHALLYEYSIKIQALKEATFKYSSFKERVFSIMNWIFENKEYNQMFTHAMKISTGGSTPDPECDFSADDNVAGNIMRYILGQIDILMEDGFNEGLFTEPDPANRSFALISSMVEYGMLISLPPITRLAGRSNEQNQDYIYKSLLQRLC